MFGDVSQRRRWRRRSRGLPTLDLKLHVARSSLVPFPRRKTSESIAICRASRGLAGRGWPRATLTDRFINLILGASNSHFSTGRVVPPSKRRRYGSGNAIAMTATCPATPIHYPLVDRANSVVVLLVDDQCISNRGIYGVEAFIYAALRTRKGTVGEKEIHVNGYICIYRVYGNAGLKR